MVSFKVADFPVDHLEAHSGLRLFGPHFCVEALLLAQGFPSFVARRTRAREKPTGVLGSPPRVLAMFAQADYFTSLSSPLLSGQQGQVNAPLS